MCLVCSTMKHDVITPANVDETLDVARILERVANVSARPRYTMLILELLAKLAREKGRAGPWVADGDALVPVREWLCEALVPMASRYARRLALVEEIRSGLSATGRLPDDPAEAAQAIDFEVRERTFSLAECAREITAARAELARYRDQLRVCALHIRSLRPSENACGTYASQA